MSPAEQLTSLVEDPNATSGRLYIEGVTALWETAIGGGTPNLLEPAHRALDRIADDDSLRVHRIHDYYGARAHLAHFALYELWTDQQATSTEAIADVHGILARMLRELMDDQSGDGRIFDHLVRTTYKTILTRLGDPYHLALPSPPIADQEPWTGPDGKHYPRCNTTVTASDNALLPCVVAYQHHLGTVMKTGVHYVGLGYQLASSTSRLPGAEKQV